MKIKNTSNMEMLVISLGRQIKPGEATEISDEHYPSFENHPYFEIISTQNSSLMHPQAVVTSPAPVVETPTEEKDEETPNND